MSKLWTPPTHNWNILKKKACLFVFDCLKGNVCSPFKNYVNFLTHDFNKRNSGTTIALQKVKLDFARKSFFFLGASAFTSLPLKIKEISSRVLFRVSLDHFLYILVNNLGSHSYLILVFILRQDPFDNSALALKGYPV